MKKNKNECKKLMSSSVLLLGLFSFLLTTSMPVNAEVATLKTTLAQITVTGKVTDSRNTPLDGISVAVKGAKTAVITDAKGMFTISVPDNGTLVFSAVGFISEEVAVKNNKVITTNSNTNSNTNNNTKIRIIFNKINNITNNFFIFLL